MLYRFFRSAGLLSLAAVIARARGLIVLPILSRYLGTADLGVWAQVGVIAYTMLPLVALGSDSGMIRLLPGLDLEAQARRFTGWLIFLGCGAAAATIAIFAGRAQLAALFFGGSDAFAPYIVLVAASLFVILLGNATRRWFQIRNDGALLAITQVLQAGANIAATVLAVALNRGLYDVLAYAILGDLASGAVSLVIIAAMGGLSRPDFSAVGPAVRFGLPMIPAAYAVWGLNWLDRVFLVQYRSFAEIGVYTAAYSIGYAVIEVFANPIWAMYPGLATQLHTKGEEKEADRLLHATGAIMLAAMAPAIAGLWALDVPIITLIAGPGYESGAVIMPIVAAGYLFLMLSGFSDLSLGLIYRQYLGTMSLMVAAVLNLILNFLLIPSLGILGAALATFAAFLMHFLLSWSLAVRWRPLWREFVYPAKIVAASAAMGLCLRAATRLFPEATVWELVVLVPSGAVLYFLLAGAMGAVQPEAKRAFQARFVALFGIGSR